MLESYIYIMQFRYMDSFEVDINLSPGILDCKVPKLILQPIVENCITHGFDNPEGVSGPESEPFQNGPGSLCSL